MNTDRLVALSEALQAAAAARALVQTPAWGLAWDGFERELLERLLRCGPSADVERYRLQVAIEAGRSVRKAFEHESKTVASLEKELDYVEGRKLAPIA